MPGMDQALVQQINQFLGKQGSPLAGFGGTFVSAGQKAGVDPRLLVAISGGETSFGKTGNASGIHNAWGWGPGISFPDWETGINTIAQGLGKNYIGQGLTTIPQIGAKWAPVGASNDPRNLNSNWVRTIGDFYSQLGGTKLAGVPSAATSLPTSTAAPLPTASVAAPAMPQAPTIGNLAGVLLGSLGKSPGAQLNSLAGALTRMPKTMPIPGTGFSIPASPTSQLPAVPTAPGVPATKGTSSVVAAAMKFLGTPYSWGGGGSKGPSLGIKQGANTKGFDCSGLLQYAYAQQGVAIDRSTYQQFAQGQTVPKASLRPGDAVFFEPGPSGPEHVGIYMGGDKFIEAPHTGANVRVSTLSTRGDYMGARRYG